MARIPIDKAITLVTLILEILRLKKKKEVDK
jgi:hypothetical protein